jgi:ABC-2 type transport system permease protein
VFLPEFMRRIGEFTPPGVQGLQDAWMGTAPQLGPILGMTAFALLVGFVAVRRFRWE